MSPQECLWCLGLDTQTHLECLSEALNYLLCHQYCMHRQCRIGVFGKDDRIRICTEHRDLHKTSIVQHLDNLCYLLLLIGRYPHPVIESLRTTCRDVAANAGLSPSRTPYRYQVRSDGLPWLLTDVPVGLQQDLRGSDTDAAGSD